MKTSRSSCYSISAFARFDTRTPAPGSGFANIATAIEKNGPAKEGGSQSSRQPAADREKGGQTPVGARFLAGN